MEAAPNLLDAGPNVAEHRRIPPNIHIGSDLLSAVPVFSQLG